MNFQSSREFQQRTPKEMRTLDGLFWVLEALLEERPTMTIQHAMVLVYVARSPGCRVTGLATLLDLNKSTMSRLLTLLGPREVDGQPGMGLICYHQDPHDIRNKLVDLSPAGRHFMRRITDKLEEL